MTTPTDRVIIVGAGVFGLSTALHLARGGYKNVTVFDYQPYHESVYDPNQGCDSASSDINKIYRCSYGKETEYQDLAFSGRPIWLEWNNTIASTPADRLPRGLTPDTKVFEPNGFMRLSEGEFSEYDLESMREAEKGGIRHFQHIINDPTDMRRLNETDGPETNWSDKIKAFNGLNDGSLSAFLDTSAGLTYADKACIWARHLCVQAGVKFVLGPKEGRLDDLVYAPTNNVPKGEKKVVGIKTVDGKVHDAEVVVVACGPWTPSLIPEAERILQATAGSVCQVKIPKNRLDLWDKYSPETFPVWAYGLTGHESPEFGGFYGFPRNSEGVLKIGYRGRKWTNIQSNAKSSSKVSTPMTKYTPVKATNLPVKAINNLKRAIDRLFPDLKEIGITGTRMCWYTDSLDNSFLIDYVPDTSSSLFIASGGSGHGFKFLPVLGKHVKNALEKRQDQFTPLWRWRTNMRQGAAAGGVNAVKESEKAQLDLASLIMATEEDWTWTEAKKEAGEVNKVGEVEVPGARLRARL